VCRRVYGTKPALVNRVGVALSQISSMLFPELRKEFNQYPDKRAMILSIMETYREQTGRGLLPENVLFFDDSVQNVALAQSVCRAHVVDNRCFNRYFLCDWLLASDLVPYVHKKKIQKFIREQATSSGQAFCQLLANCLAQCCHRNNIHIVVFDLDQTLLKIHAFYAGVSLESIDRENRNLDSDFADIELVRAFCRCFETD